MESNIQMHASLHSLHLVSVDIIDSEYCLMYGFPSDFDINELKMHLLNWKIPYVAIYNGFLFTWNQLVWFMKGLQNGFRITYEIPPFKYWNKLLDLKNPSSTNHHSLIMQPFKLTQSQIQSVAKISQPSIRMILNDGWGYGKTVVSLNIAMSKLSTSNLKILVVIAPSVLHDHWMQHFRIYCKDYSITKNCRQLIQKACNPVQTQKSIILINPYQVNELGYIENIMEGFLIYDEIQLISSDSVVLLRNFSHLIILANCCYRQNIALMANMLTMLAVEQPLSFFKSRYGHNQHQYELINAIRIFQSCEASQNTQSYSSSKTIKYRCKIPKLQAIEEYLLLIFSKDQIASYVFFYTDLEVLGILRKISDMYTRKAHLNHCYIDKDRIYLHLEEQESLDRLIHIFLGVPIETIFQHIDLHIHTRQQFFISEESHQISSKNLWQSEQTTCLKQQSKTAKKSILVDPKHRARNNKKKRVSFVADTALY